LQGILVLYFLIIVAIFATVFYRCCYAGADCKNAAAATMGAICLGDVSMAPRTLLFGWLCMAALLLVLDHFDATGKGLWMLPFLFALWINLHGSWVFGMVVLCITIAAGLVQGRWGLVVARRWTPSQLKRLLLAFICSCLALFVNPFGYALVFYPKFLLTHQHEVMQSIEEWQPVNFATWGGKVALMLIFSVLATLLFSRRHWKLQEALIVLFSLWAALSHGRFMFFAALTIIPVLAPSLKLFPPYDQKLDKPWLNALIIAVSIAGMVFFFPTAAQIQKKIDAEFPRHAIDFIQKNQISGRIFNEYSWGGYMEWNAPRLQIFMDGRADVFIYSGVFHDYLTVEAVQGSFETLDRYGIDYVLIRPRQPLAVALQHSPQWRTVYSDKVAVLFRRGTAAAVSSQLGG